MFKGLEADSKMVVQIEMDEKGCDKYGSIISRAEEEKKG